MDSIRMVPHDPRWRDLFALEAQTLRAALGDTLVALHHIGSTSIEGIHAKPIIDLLAEVRDLDAVDASSARLSELGWEARGEYGIPGRRYFRKDAPRGVRTHQLHAFRAGSDQVRRHLAFRDYLRAHPDAARQYSELKQRLAHQHPHDADAYMDGKDAFIRELDRRAAEWRRTRSSGS